MINQKTYEEKRENVRILFCGTAVITPLCKKKQAYENSTNSLSLLQKKDSTLLNDNNKQNQTSDYNLILKQINLKLDKIINLISEKKTDNSLLSEILDISGKGVKLLIPSSISIETLLKIELKLPGIKQSNFILTGKVVHVKSVKIEKTDYFEAGINFINLSKEQKEILISYTFILQRKAIRELKNNIRNVDEIT